MLPLLQDWQPEVTQPKQVKPVQLKPKVKLQKKAAAEVQKNVKGQKTVEKKVEAKAMPRRPAEPAGPPPWMKALMF